MTWEQLHPAINAALNFTCFVFLVLGRIAIARGDRDRHRRRMIGATTAAAIFLVSYVIRVASSGVHAYPGDGWDRRIYLFTLTTHMSLAALLAPMVVIALRHALRGNFAKHRRIVHFAWPIWMYVSVTGVLVYFMLYHLAPALHAT